jgi:hypothetical protein
MSTLLVGGGGTSIDNDNKNINIKLYMLDPLSVIVKLAILGKKPVGTKISINENVIYFQEPGMFQGFCRYIFHTNKTELQYLYNPIQIACKTYLSSEYIAKTPRMKQLFLCSLSGITNLMETYKACSIIRLCLNYFYTIIVNHVEQIYNDNIFHKDGMTSIYTEEMVICMHAQWTHEKIKVILDIISFLANDSNAIENVKSLENIMRNIDKETQKIVLQN